jgi:hypothetical protein
MPEGLDDVDIARTRDLRGRMWEIWVRRACVLILAAVPVLALWNVFGQAATNARASSPAAVLLVHSPERVRGGLLFEVRFTIRAHQELSNATLRLSRGWADGLTINTIEPSPANQGSQDSNLVFELGDIKAGDTFVLHMDYQVNPTTVDSRSQHVELLDGSTPLVGLTRHLTVLP